MKKHNQTFRRKGALERLEAQLKSGVKPTKDGDIPLEDKDTKRINKEVEILKSKINKETIV